MALTVVPLPESLLWESSYILLACAILRWVFVPSLSSSIQSLRGLTSVFLNLYSS